MRTGFAAFGAGVLFAFGLALSGMTQPANVVAFLDVTGAWDPRLALVMVGAIAVHLVGYRWSRRRPRPWLAPRFDEPESARIDASLIVGAALFGVGWGVAGYCPGPALTSLGALSPSAVLFVAAMIVGQILFAGYRRIVLRGVAGSRPAPTSSAAMT
jgi:uncharacterized membrane protein YedE/YeeE